ncbi:MAG: division plane positioning ATPase MipZ [Alphaproteobacteria bacterium]
MPRSVIAPAPKAPPAKAVCGAYVIVFGNEKGGTVKTMIAMHVAVALLKLGRKVAALDLDSRQQTMVRYFENRAAFMERTKHALPMPQLKVVKAAREQDEMVQFGEALAQARTDAQFIVIDTPGSDTPLSRLGHAAADTLVTPMNDSFLDFDLLAHLQPENLEVTGPSLYGEFVWDCRKRRLMSRQPPLDWVVMRNRVFAVEARNKRRVAAAVDALSKRIGFRVAPGFSERVIFHELQRSSGEKENDVGGDVMLRLVPLLLVGVIGLALLLRTAPETSLQPQTVAIATLTGNPSNFDREAVLVRGTVRSAVGFFDVRAFKLADDTSDIIVVTRTGIPEIGSVIVIRGTFRQAFVIGRTRASVVVRNG